MTMTARAIFLPVSCFLYRLGEPKPTEKWSTYMKISEGSFSDFKKRFTLLFTVSSEDEWRIYQDFMLEDNAKEYELVGEFSKFLYYLVV